MGVGALHTLWKGFDDCNYSPTLWHSTQWKTTIRQLLFLTADTKDVHTKAAHFVTALFTLEVHLCMWICERCPLLFVFVALYKLSRFMHAVSVNLSLSTQSCRLFLCPSLQTFTHGEAADPLVCTQSPQQDLRQHFWGLDKPWMGMRETGMWCWSWAHVFSVSLVHISLAALCAEWWLLDLVLLPRGLLLYCRRLRQKISKLILEEQLLPLISRHNSVLLAKDLRGECGDFCSSESTLAIVCHWRFWDVTKCVELFQNHQFLRTNINNS